MHTNHRTQGKCQRRCYLYLHTNCCLALPKPRAIYSPSHLPIRMLQWSRCLHKSDWYRIFSCRNCRPTAKNLLRRISSFLSNNDRLVQSFQDQERLFPPTIPISQQALRNDPYRQALHKYLRVKERSTLQNLARRKLKRIMVLLPTHLRRLRWHLQATKTRLLYRTVTRSS